MCKKFPTETLNVVKRRQLFSAKPTTPSRAMDYGQLSKIIITKPQHVYCGRSSEAAGGPVTSPISQWERRAGNRDRGGRADSQWGKRDEPEGKLGD